MNQEERKERIKYLARKEDRKNRLPELLNYLMSITDEIFTENDVLNLEQIDAFQANLNSSDFDFNYLNLSFPKSQFEKLKKLLRELENELCQANYFRLGRFLDIAVLTSDTNFVIENFEEIIKFDENTFSVYDHNFKNGLWIDLNEEFWHEMNNSERIWIYEIRVFGKDWIKKIMVNL